MNRIFFTLLLIIQVCFSYFTKDIKPVLQLIPPIPSKIETEILSDTQFMFRKYAMDIQIAGDTFGQNTPLKDYNYKKLQKWFFLLDDLDEKSNFPPSIAAYYFSQTQNKPDVRYIVDYLVTHSEKNIEKNWWWMYQASYLANSKLKDKQLALEIAYKLNAVKGDIPIWARQSAAFIHEELGEKEEAYLIMKAIADEYDDLSEGEQNFINYFIKERLEYLDINSDIKK